MKILSDFGRLISAGFRKRIYKIFKKTFDIEEIEWKPNSTSPLFSKENNVSLPFDWVIGARTLAFGHWHDEQLCLIRNIQQLKNHKKYFLVDVGANSGLVTRQLVGQDKDGIWAGAVCFEPEARNFTRLKRNTSHISNVFSYQNGISASDETIALNIDSGNSGDYSLDELPAMKNRSAVSQQYVDVISASKAWNIIESHNPSGFPIVWKSDTQGHDLRIITALPRNSWKSIEIAMVEVCSRSSTDAEISSFIEFVSDFRFLKKIKRRQSELSILELEEFCRRKSSSEFDILIWR